MHSWAAFRKSRHGFTSLSSCLVPMESRSKKKTHLPIQTRWGSELPEGPYWRNLKESASHHFICFCAAARRKCLKWCSEGQLQPRNHQNFENQVLTHIVKGTPHPIAQIKIWMSSCEAYVKIWDAFETLFSFLVPLSSRFTKKSKKRIQTRWGSELPEGRY